MASLISKTVVITGSSRGIGRAAAEACAQAGATVIISSRKPENVNRVVAELQRSGLPVSGIAANVVQPEEIQRLFDYAIHACGKIDVWINNAGISGGYRTIQAMSPEDLKQVLDINLLGTFNACRILIPYFREEHGIILNMGGRGAKGNASPYQAPYAATKAGILSLTRSLAAENKGYPLSINCIMPGMVVTEMYNEVATCPETQDQMAIMPVLLRAFASPMPDVQRLVVKVCAQEPGKHSGKCYSAEKWTRYFRALATMPDFMRTGAKIRRAKQNSRT